MGNILYINKKEHPVNDEVYECVEKLGAEIKRVRNRLHIQTLASKRYRERIKQLENEVEMQEQRISNLYVSR